MKLEPEFSIYSLSSCKISVLYFVLGPIQLLQVCINGLISISVSLQ